MLNDVANWLAGEPLGELLDLVILVNASQYQLELLYYFLLSDFVHLKVEQ